MPWHTVALSSDELGLTCVAALAGAAPPAIAPNLITCGSQTGQRQDDGDRRATKRRSSETVRFQHAASIPATSTATELDALPGLQRPSISTQQAGRRSCFELHNVTAAAAMGLPDAVAAKSPTAEDGLPPRQPRRRNLLPKGSLSGSIATANGLPPSQPQPPCLMRTLSLGSAPEVQEHRSCSLPGHAAAGAGSSVMGRRFSSHGEDPPWGSTAGRLPALPTDGTVVVARVGGLFAPTPEGAPIRAPSCSGAPACHSSVTPTAMLTPVGCFDFGPQHGGCGNDGGAEGFRILTVLTCGSDDVSLGGERGSSERQVRRERHRRAAAAVEPPSGAFQPAMLLHQQCETGDGGECPSPDDCDEELPCDELGSRQLSPWQPRFRSGYCGDLGRAGSTPGFKQDLFGSSSPSDGLPWLQPDDGFETPASPAGKLTESPHGCMTNWHGKKQSSL